MQRLRQDVRPALKPEGRPRSGRSRRCACAAVRLARRGEAALLRQCEPRAGSSRLGRGGLCCCHFRLCDFRLTTSQRSFFRIMEMWGLGCKISLKPCWPVTSVPLAQPKRSVLKTLGLCLFGLSFNLMVLLRCLHHKCLSP